MDDEYVWPEPGGSFFEFNRTRPDAYTWMRQSLDEYAYMYRGSAELLMEKACDAPGLLNVHAIPAVYLFRHFVELSLKHLLVQAGRLNDQDGSFPGKHRLEPLRRKLRDLLEEAHMAESDEERSTLEVVDGMIQQLDTADPSAMAFRYPVGMQQKDGSRDLLLSEDLEYFDMRVVRDQARRLAHSTRAAANSCTTTSRSTTTWLGSTRRTCGNTCERTFLTTGEWQRVQYEGVDAHRWVRAAGAAGSSEA